MTEKKVALVTGASRGVGKGVAEALGEAGYVVYITGRSESPNETVPLPGTIHETAQSVTDLGGEGIAIRCDHKNDAEVKAVFEQIQSEQGRLDLLVNNAWAGYQEMQLHGAGRFMKPFWKTEPIDWDTTFDVGVRSNYVASMYAAQMMVFQNSGLIVNISYSASETYKSNVVYGVSKAAVDKMTNDMAHELRKKAVACVAIWPGLVKTEMLLKRLNGKPRPYAETPRFIGRAVVALANDPDIMAKSGQVLKTRELAREYQFTEVDGSMPPLNKGL
ncbi:MAG: SDR family NAD(P)-dependent oxidoreductase [Anaerolineae bacterium]